MAHLASGSAWSCKKKGTKGQNLPFLIQPVQGQRHWTGRKGTFWSLERWIHVGQVQFFRISCASSELFFMAPHFPIYILIKTALWWIISFLDFLVPGRGSSKYWVPAFWLFNKGYFHLNAWIAILIYTLVLGEFSSHESTYNLELFWRWTQQARPPVWSYNFSHNVSISSLSFTLPGAISYIHLKLISLCKFSHHLPVLRPVRPSLVSGAPALYHLLSKYRGSSCSLASFDCGGISDPKGCPEPKYVWCLVFPEYKYIWLILLCLLALRS